MNALFQEYKRQVDECKTVLVDYLDIPFEVKAMEFYIDEPEKEKYNRAKEKQKTQKLIDEYYEDQR